MTTYGPWLQRDPHTFTTYVTFDSNVISPIDPFFGEIFYDETGEEPVPTDWAAGANLSGLLYECVIFVGNGPDGPATDPPYPAWAAEHYRLGRSSSLSDPLTEPVTPLGDEFELSQVQSGLALDSTDAPIMFTRYQGTAPGLFTSSVTYDGFGAFGAFGPEKGDTRVEPPGDEWPSNAVGVEYAPGSENDWFEFVGEVAFEWAYEPGGPDFADSDGVSVYFSYHNELEPTTGWQRNYQPTLPTGIPGGQEGVYADPSDLSSITGSGPAQPILTGSDSYSWDADFINALHSGPFFGQAVSLHFIALPDRLMNADTFPSGVHTEAAGGQVTYMRWRGAVLSAPYRFILEEVPTLVGTPGPIRRRFTRPRP